MSKPSEAAQEGHRPHAQTIRIPPDSSPAIIAQIMRDADQPATVAERLRQRTQPAVDDEMKR